MNDLDYLTTSELIDALYDRATDLVVYYGGADGKDAMVCVKGAVGNLARVSRALEHTSRDWRTVSPDATDATDATTVFAEHLDDEDEDEDEG